MSLKPGIKIGLPLIAAVVLMAALFYHFRGYFSNNESSVVTGIISPESVLTNYGEEIKKSAALFQFQPEFLAALCMLESGGRKPVPARFEKHVYGRLKMVQLGLKTQYEHVQKEDLAFAGDEALKNLASSWGPFQLMGYKCLLYDIKVKDLRGENGVYWATLWMNENYGKYLQKGDYANAFHIHNAGMPVPKNGKYRTHDPDYIKKGLEWMAYFKNKL